MIRLLRSKSLAIALILSSILFYGPHPLVGQSPRTGNLIGHIYDADSTTPVEGAVIIIRNISDNTIQESNESNTLGAVKIDHIEEGLYVLGIWTKDGGYNINSIVGIKANETVEISLALEALVQEKNAQKKEAEKKETEKKETKYPRGKWYYPEVMGECDEGYRWNPKTLRCEWKTKGIGKFFGSPQGIATVLAATFIGGYGIIKLTEAEAEASPFK